MKECECNCHVPNEYGIQLGWLWCPKCEGNHGVGCYNND